MFVSSILRPWGATLSSELPMLWSSDLRRPLLTTWLDCSPTSTSMIWMMRSQHFLLRASIRFAMKLQAFAKVLHFAQVERSPAKTVVNEAVIEASGGRNLQGHGLNLQWLCVNAASTYFEQVCVAAEQKKSESLIKIKHLDVTGLKIGTHHNHLWRFQDDALTSAPQAACRSLSKATRQHGKIMRNRRIKSGNTIKYIYNIYIYNNSLELHTATTCRRSLQVALCWTF